MSIIVEGGDHGELAHVRGNDSSYYTLGKKGFFGSLGKVDKTLAEVQKVVIRGHNLVEHYLDQVKPEEVPVSIAMLNLFTNLLLPKELAHEHPELQKKIGSDTVSLASMHDIQIEVLQKGLDLLSNDINKNTEYYKNELGVPGVLSSLQMIVDARQFSLDKYESDGIGYIFLKQ